MSLEGLNKLDVSYASITGEINPQYIKANQLHTLELKECLFVTDQGIVVILNSVNKSLKCLALTCLEITGEGLVQITEELKNLESLKMYLCENLTDQGLSNVLRVSGSKLVSLNIGSNDSLTGDQFHMFEDKFASLKKLVCSRCNGLSDENLCILLRCLSKIESLDLGYSSFKGEKLTDFQTEWSNLENVDLSLCESLQRKVYQTYSGFQGIN